MSLAIYLVLPSLARFAKGIELKAVAQKIAGILRYYRTEAMQKGQIYQVLLDLQKRELIVRAMPLDDQEEGALKWIEKNKYRIPGSINLRAEEIGLSAYPTDLPAIEFYPTGNSNGGHLLLEDQGQKIYRIKISFLTGIIAVEKI